MWKRIGLIIFALIFVAAVVKYGHHFGFTPKEWLKSFGLMKIISLLVSIPIILMIFIAIVYGLAKIDLIFTIVEEGTAKGVYRFEKLSRIVMSYTDRCMNKSGDVVEEKDALKNIFGGLKILGVPFVHSLRKKKFRWTSWVQTKEGEKIVERPKSTEKEIDYVFVKDDQYFLFVENAETLEMIPVDFSLLLSIRIKNIKKALTRTDDWLETAQNRVSASTREFSSQQSFHRVYNTVELGATSKTDIKKTVEALNMFLKDTLTIILETYGVDVFNVEILNIDPSGEVAKTVREKSLQEYSALRDKEKVLIDSDAEAQRLDKVYGKVKELGDTGRFIRAMEAIEKSSNKIIIPANMGKGVNFMINLDEEKGGEK